LFMLDGAMLGSGILGSGILLYPTSSLESCFTLLPMSI
jgi:hypothetical protein